MGLFGITLLESLENHNSEFDIPYAFGEVSFSSSTRVTGSSATDTTSTSTTDDTPEIPGWIKNNAAWWADGLLDDGTFVSGLQFLIKEGIIVLPPTEQGSSDSVSEIPGWIKNNAKWWADGLLDDGTFVSGIQFLIKEGIIQV